MCIMMHIASDARTHTAHAHAHTHPANATKAHRTGVNPSRRFVEKLFQIVSVLSHRIEPSRNLSNQWSITQSENQAYWDSMVLGQVCVSYQHVHRASTDMVISISISTSAPAPIGLWAGVSTCIHMHLSTSTYRYPPASLWEGEGLGYRYRGGGK